MMKDNWLNIPGTIGQFKRFFLGAKDQQASNAQPEKVKAVA
jgi:hypothetical protein